MIRVGILGASGFAGAELVRLLCNHPHVELAYLVSRSHVGKQIAELYPDLEGLCSHRFVSQPEDGADVVFLALPHGTARQLLEQYRQLHHSIIIDLSADHRSDASFIYGLPERYREQIRSTRRIANPGCFATALLLSLLPLEKARALPSTVYASGITGSTGAGAELSPTTHFSWRFANVQAYSILNHRHAAEVCHVLGKEGLNVLHFVPYRGPFTRGIITTVVFETTSTAEHLHRLYCDYYAWHRLVHVVATSPDLKAVVGSARAMLSCTVCGSTAAVTCVLDNMLKGAAAQAVQNMNLALGIDEYTALPLRSIGW